MSDDEVAEMMNRPPKPTPSAPHIRATSDDGYRCIGGQGPAFCGLGPGPDCPACLPPATKPLMDAHKAAVTAKVNWLTIGPDMTKEIEAAFEVWLASETTFSECLAETEAELARLRAENATHDPAYHLNRWRGLCGHEWRKDQAEDCPICALASLSARVADVLRFYASPPKGEPVPDFYDELQFGERAATLLKELEP